MAVEHAHDAIVLDAMLPGLDGFEVCRLLREQRCWTPAERWCTGHQLTVESLCPGEAPNQVSAGKKAIFTERQRAGL